MNITFSDRISTLRLAVGALSGVRARPSFTCARHISMTPWASHTTSHSRAHGAMRQRPNCVPTFHTCSFACTQPHAKSTCNHPPGRNDDAPRQPTEQPHRTVRIGELGAAQGHDGPRSAAKTSTGRPRRACHGGVDAEQRVVRRVRRWWWRWWCVASWGSWSI
jgi:hypothetical protein